MSGLLQTLAADAPHPVRPSLSSAAASLTCLVSPSGPSGRNSISTSGVQGKRTSPCCGFHSPGLHLSGGRLPETERRGNASRSHFWSHRHALRSCPQHSVELLNMKMMLLCFPKNDALLSPLDVCTWNVLMFFLL